MGFVQDNSHNGTVLDKAELESTPATKNKRNVLTILLPQ